MSENIVSASWLHERLSSPDIAILDCSWHLPAANRNAKDEFLARHIPGAQFFDIDATSDRSSLLPHMLPRPEAFSSAVRKLGVGDGKRVVCYDAAGLFSAARVWWMFRVFGHREVCVLDGGLPKWIAERRPLEEGRARSPQDRHFTARYQSMMLADKASVQSARQVVDARSPSRFRGEEPEPRAGVQPGHIPGSRNLHYATLLRPDGTLKPPAELKALFAETGIDISQPIVTTCGSGVTAAILSLSLSEIGARAHSLYDGSWAEWGSDPETQKATGP